jgi:2-isopropylmalate synthase
MKRIEIYDTTLRDGSQGEGVSFSLQDKLLICHRLDELGVDFIEGGYPLSNPKDAAFFNEARELKLHTAKLLAFGMTRRKGVAPADDVGLNALRDAHTQYVTVVGKTWDIHATEVLGVSLQENLDMIADSVAYLTGLGRKVIYDAEHFFDGFKANPDYALKTITAAAQAGAILVCLCDTNGGTLPPQVQQCVRQALETVKIPVGIHPHNDSGVAVANALAAVTAGATQVQGTINGIGERCGNVDITTVIANLRLKLGYDCLKKDSLVHLTETSRYVYEIANLNLVNNQPYTGASAFAHKGGMHVHAVNKMASSYEHVEPELVGNSRRILVSELSGISNIAAKAGKKFNIEKDRTALKNVLDQVTELESQGYQFEAAEASFELILRRQIGRMRKFFELKNYRCAVSRQGHGQPVTKATISVAANGRDINASAEGDGPINALDAALRHALEPEFPAIADLHLVDYKVRVVNGRAESAAKVRVVIEFRSPEGVFGTIGVSENIIEASWQAIADAVDYRLVHAEEAAAVMPAGHPAM